MAALYPPLEPFGAGLLPVGDGNAVYWEQCGNPRGKPALVLHGGPGSGCTPGMRRYFDPARYRVVLMDQRNCGRSTPHAAEHDLALAANTTEHLIGDIELLRRALGIERWLVYGMSWGCTLGLAYAQRHPERVSELVFSAVTLTRREDVHWLYHGLADHFPEDWARFAAEAPGWEEHGSLVEAYRRRLSHPDRRVRERAAAAWCDWEDAIVPEGRPNPRYADPRFRMAFARIVTHYFAHGAWLEDGQLLRDAERLDGTPGVLIHGKDDLASRVSAAEKLAAAWPGAELVTIGSAGHSSAGPGMAGRIVAALDRFAAV